METYREHLSGTLLGALGRLEEAVQSAGKCCDLKTITFEGGNVPDYGRTTVQDLYLLRYYGAYVCEYRVIYRIAFEFLDLPLVIRSVGAGSGADLAGLYYESVERQVPQNEIRWRGYDRIAWANRVTFPGVSAEYHDATISALKPLAENVNMLLFAKSLADIDETEFSAFLEILGKSNFKRDKFLLASSTRTTEFGLSHDAGRLNRVAKILTERHGYKSDDPANRYWFMEPANKAWSSRMPGFSVPDQVVEYIQNLAERCPTRVKNGKACEPDCMKALSRQPMLRGTTFRYQFMRFGR